MNKDNVDLSQGETPETTTTIGLKLLEQFRKTIDKQYVSPPFILLRRLDHYHQPRERVQTYNPVHYPHHLSFFDSLHLIC